MAKTYPEQTARRQAAHSYDDMCLADNEFHTCDLPRNHQGKHQCVMYPTVCDKGEFEER